MPRALLLVLALLQTGGVFEVVKRANCEESAGATAAMIARRTTRHASAACAPEIMTAATAILGLLPAPRAPLVRTEIERPLAIARVGGLITSTLFTLLALPTFYQLVHSVGARWRGQEMKP